MTETNAFVTTETSWCPGCGNFGILAAVKQALSDLGCKPHKVLLAGGIGQAAKTPLYFSANGICTLHGRALPAATGVRIANHELTVVVHSGDGDCYAEGGNHFVHAIRRNVDLTLLVHNNQVYGLTRGQASPTSDPGHVTGVQPRGVIANPLNGPALAIVLGCGFVARSFSGTPEHLVDMIRQGVRHRGFSLIEILQPCISMNKLNTFAWYKQRIDDVAADPEFDPTDRERALARAGMWGDKIPVGVLYRQEGIPFEERIPMLTPGPLVKQPPLARTILAELQEEFI
jgi:2-oxoglutarate ferredoxin oxidoreductase subunit beta